MAPNVEPSRLREVQQHYNADIFPTGKFFADLRREHTMELADSDDDNENESDNSSKDDVEAVDQLPDLSASSPDSKGHAPGLQTGRLPSSQSARVLATWQHRQVEPRGRIGTAFDIHTLLDPVIPLVEKSRPASEPSFTAVQPMNIAILVVGTRGDVQPFIALSLKLQEYGHRVRLASHEPYRDFVESCGVEFYPLKGDPKVLSEYVVKNRGLIGLVSLEEISMQRRQLTDIIFSTKPACTEADPLHPDKPFRADYIIANPVVYAHIHMAEYLGVPLHIIFTMPWSPTTEFPTPWIKILGTKHHRKTSSWDGSSMDLEKELTAISSDSGNPLARGAHSAPKLPTPILDGAGTLVQASAVGSAPLPPLPSNNTSACRILAKRPRSYSHSAGSVTDWREGVYDAVTRNLNWQTYFALDQLMWMGTRSIIERFRKELNLPSTGRDTGAHSLHYSKVPFTYIWSPSLVPKPEDWSENINVTGFVFLPLKDMMMYTPPPELDGFLKSGPPPVYIGFGSLVVENPKRLTHRIYKMVRNTGVRAVVQQGWGDLGTSPDEERPAGVLVIGNCPHDWLFPRCSAVIHHGGAGTTAAGLRFGKPTFIVPFFGDQPFWGDAVAAAGVGPRPVPIDRLTSKKLVSAVMAMQQPGMLAAAAALSEALMKEDGVQNTVDSIHKHMAAVGHSLADDHRDRYRSAAAAWPTRVQRLFRRHPKAAASTENSGGAATENTSTSEADDDDTSPRQLHTHVIHVDLDDPTHMSANDLRMRLLSLREYISGLRRGSGASGTTAAPVAPANTPSVSSAASSASNSLGHSRASHDSLAAQALGLVVQPAIAGGYVANAVTTSAARSCNSHAARTRGRVDAASARVANLVDSAMLQTKGFVEHTMAKLHVGKHRRTQSG